MKKTALAVEEHRLWFVSKALFLERVPFADATPERLQRCERLTPEQLVDRIAGQFNRAHVTSDEADRNLSSILRDLHEQCLATVSAQFEVVPISQMSPKDAILIFPSTRSRTLRNLAADYRVWFYEHGQ